MYNSSMELNDNTEKLIRKYCKILKDNKFSYYCSHYDRYLGQIKIKGITYNFRKNSLNITIDKDLIKNRVYTYVVYYDNQSFSYKNLPLASFEDILNYI